LGIYCSLVASIFAGPGKLNYGSSGAGGLTHYSVELFQARTGIKVVHIPFKGGAPSTAAVVSGEAPKPWQPKPSHLGMARKPRGQRVVGRPGS
jgi:hypothetical protein